MYTKETISKKENNGKHRTALVLEGGAMRGIFSAGVIDVLMENNIHFDAVITGDSQRIGGIAACAP